jgi:hypothetical protein
MNEAQKLQWMFEIYKDLNIAVTDEGVKVVLDDIHDYYPDLYDALDQELQRRRKMKELGALLV